jgi:hypothetical protein
MKDTDGRKSQKKHSLNLERGQDHTLANFTAQVCRGSKRQVRKDRFRVDYKRRCDSVPKMTNMRTGNRNQAWRQKNGIVEAMAAGESRLVFLRYNHMTIVSTGKGSETPIRICVDSGCWTKYFEPWSPNLRQVPTEDHAHVLRYKRRRLPSYWKTMDICVTVSFRACSDLFDFWT